MRIAIVGPGFTGASLPLAQHIQMKGNEVDCYYLTRIGLDSIESLDFSVPLSRKQKEMKISLSNNVYKYLNSSINVYIEPIYKLHLWFEKYLLWYIPRWANRIRIKGFLQRLLSRKYDSVILIDHFDDEQIARTLAKKNVRFIITFHEVLKIQTGKPLLRNNIIPSLQLKRPTVLHSNKVKNDLFQFSEIESESNRIFVIPFGPFESFLQYGKGKCVSEAGENFFLCLGSITTYKGLDILYDAIERIHCQNIKIVVAGKGFVHELEVMKKNKKYIIINRFISNDEVVWLVRNCRAVLCPYVAASQSGLVPLAMAFNKPVIANRVGAFPEYIEDGVNGYLSESISGEGFAETINRFFIDEQNFNGKVIPQYLNWDYISNQMINLLNKNE